MNKFLSGYMIGYSGGITQSNLTGFNAGLLQGAKQGKAEGILEGEKTGTRQGYIQGYDEGYKEAAQFETIGYKTQFIVSDKRTGTVQLFPDTDEGKTDFIKLFAAEIMADLTEKEREELLANPTGPEFGKYKGYLTNLFSQSNYQKISNYMKPNFTPPHLENIPVGKTGGKKVTLFKTSDVQYFKGNKLNPGDLVVIKKAEHGPAKTLNLFKAAQKTGVIPKIPKDQYYSNILNSKGGPLLKSPLYS